MQWRNLAALLTTATFLPGATIHLKTGNLETVAGQDDHSTRSLKRRTPGKSHYLLQFSMPIGREQLDRLAERGAVVTSSIPDATVMVAAGDDLSTDGMGIQWSGHLRAADKVSLELDSLRTNEQAAFIVEFHSDMDMEDARQLILDAGLDVLERVALLKNQLLVSGASDIVKSLADWDEVAYIFPASNDLIAGIDVIGCAGALTLEGLVAQYVKIGHGWPVEGSNGVQIRYVFADLTNKVPAPTIKAEIERAFQEWTKYAKIQFVPGTDGSAPQTVRVMFAKGDHGDPYPFDGPGGTLAHTFYPSPPNPEPLAGDMHLDSDENWHAGANIDIYTVALHETGHALGLGHSDKPGAIMYPYYRLGATIGEDDIAGIRNLYGEVSVNTSPLSLTVKNPVSTAFETTAPAIAISGSTSGATGSTKVVWQTDHGDAGAATGSAAWAAGSVPLAAGINTITLTATDEAHHTASSTLSITRTATPTAPAVPDTTRPSLSITSPGLTIISTNSAVITVRGTASDNTGVVKVSWSNSPGGTQGTAVGTMDWTADVPLHPGTNTVSLSAFDAAGNSRLRSLTVVRR